MNKQLSDNHLREVFTNWQPETPSDQFPVIWARYQRGRKRYPYLTWLGAAAIVLVAIGITWYFLALRSTSSKPTLVQSESNFEVDQVSSNSINVQTRQPQPRCFLSVDKKESIAKKSENQLQKKLISNVANESPCSLVVLEPLTGYDQSELLPFELTTPASNSIASLQFDLPALPIAAHSRWSNRFQRVWNSVSDMAWPIQQLDNFSYSRLRVQCETPWFSYTHELKTPHLELSDPISLLNPQ